MAAGDGLISMTPTSIAYSGTSASINADGGVDFSAVTSLSLNGVFTGDYDNYLIAISHTSTAETNNFIRLRSAGSDATGSNYTYQYLFVENTSRLGARATVNSAALVGSLGLSTNGLSVFVYGPALAQPTAFRGVSVYSQPTLYDVANTHSLSTSYDGFTYYPNSGNITGNIHVFGYEE